MSGGTSLDVEVSQKVPGISSLPHGKLEQLLYEAVQWQGGTFILNFQLLKIAIFALIQASEELTVSYKNCSPGVWWNLSRCRGFTKGAQHFLSPTRKTGAAIVQSCAVARWDLSSKFSNSNHCFNKASQTVS